MSQTTTVLKWLANLSCALEDHQSFMEAEEPDLAEVSRAHAADAIEGIRTALTQIERNLDLSGGSPAGGLDPTARALTTAVHAPSRVRPAAKKAA